MSVAFYRNRLNKDTKKLGKFSKKIKEDLQENEVDIDVIFEDKKEKCLEKLKKNDTLIIIAHGDDDHIYHKYDFKNQKYPHHQTLFSQDNVSELAGKKVIAISCRTARNLGVIACENVGCKVYLGFYNQIHFDRKDGKYSSKEYVVFLRECYRDTFSGVIEKAILEKWTFNKLKIILGHALNKVAMIKAQHIKRNNKVSYKNNGIEQALLAVSNVADNIMVLGNSQEIIA
ncbi:hypothetical protein [Crassaminicella profunda]|uniref:hypothetical protein n=1 Tax=Crassaminicella profunda TaxID=1286698 RepID=UPI001CA718C8|nr:hypothetical protein [Crassaminicella profunda]QZY56487.1 hypothetical protein K7H06_06055 [Crassaminicella profunda]